MIDIDNIISEGKYAYVCHETSSNVSEDTEKRNFIEVLIDNENPPYLQKISNVVQSNSKKWKIVVVLMLKLALLAAIFVLIYMFYMSYDSINYLY